MPNPKVISRTFLSYRRVWIMLISALVLTVLLSAALLPSSSTNNTNAVSDMLSQSDNKFTKVTSPRNFSFPKDHGPHSDYKTEWWYFTGNLESENRRRFGYQLTLFRIGLARDIPRRTSTWAASEIYMAHFAVTDIASQQFYYSERFARAAQDLAGAQAQPFRVWLEDWAITSRNDTFLPLKLVAQTDDIAIDLELNSHKPLVLQGDKGFSQKSAHIGNASYYYSFTRMPTHGRITINGQDFNVTGLSWADREWSTSALAENQAGWDWFSLQLNDGRDIMFYQLRRKDGSTDPASSGSLVLENGTTKQLSAQDVILKPMSYWLSPKTGIRYPIEWLFKIPKIGLALNITAAIKNQELDLSVRYWEGAIQLSGQADGTTITGRGYLELAGY